jgi:ATPase subunit of ABC transporter with duplicated ATPase domains
MPFEFSLPEPGAIGTPVLGVEAVSFGYDAVHGLLFQNVHFGVDMESRIGN